MESVMETANLIYLALGMVLGWALGFGMSFLIFVVGKDDKPDDAPQEHFHIDRQ